MTHTSTCTQGRNQGETQVTCGTYLLSVESRVATRDWVLIAAFIAQGPSVSQSVMVNNEWKKILQSRSEYMYMFLGMLFLKFFKFNNRCG